MSVSSSPDPLILPMDSSPIRNGQRRRAKGPLSSRSINIASPSKSVFLEANNDENGSPWRIKVTVQAEPASPEINRRVRTSRAPLKNGGSRPTKRPTTQSRRSPSRSAKSSPRKPISSTRRRSSVQAHDLIEIPDDPTSDYSLSELEPNSARTQDENRHESSFDARNNYSLSPDDGFHAHLQEPHSTEPSAQHLQPSSTAPISSQPSQHTSPGFPAEVDWSDNEEVVAGAEHPGDATVLESEEFSMISVDSLSSAPRLDYHNGSATLEVPSHSNNLKPSTDSSVMPSSPPTYLPAYRRTPLPSDSSPKYPPAPAQPSQHTQVEAPLQESARKSGKALQDVVTGLFRESTPRSSRNPIFNAFSAGTRRQLRESLYAGQTLATPQIGSQPNFGLGAQGAPHFAAPVPTFSSPFHSPIRRDSNVAHRLPTPEEKQALPLNPTDSAGGVQYSRLDHTALDESLAISYRAYDDMSWMATDATRAIPVQEPSLQKTESQAQGSTSPGSSLTTRSNYDAVSAAESDNGLQEALLLENNANDEASKDIWQQEGSRSVDEDLTPPIMEDGLPRHPRRAKLPGTWRRTSEANFHYSDSPEPEHATIRKVSAATSASGIMTPPTTEDENLEADLITPVESENEEEEEAEGQQYATTDDERLSTMRSTRSCLSTDTDDTGVFWQRNLPSIFNRPLHTRRAKNNAASVQLVSMDSKMLMGSNSTARSRLEDTALESPPVENTSCEVDAVNIASQAHCIFMPSPVKRSLLKSSKLSDTAVVPIKAHAMPLSSTTDRTLPSSAQDDETVANLTSSSLASDARQLRDELTQQLSVSQVTSPIDVTKSSSSSEGSSFVAETDISQSYVEELNRESPTKVKVNFNDSSVHDSGRDSGLHDNDGRSILISPKKQYPPLFDQASSLEPVAAMAESKAISQASSQPRVRKGGYVSRLTGTFWDAVKAQPVYTDSRPTVVISTSPAPTYEAVAKPPLVNASVPDHVLRLRRKYGLLPHIHPFTYAHVRTLHRMLNSTRSRSGASSIIPISGLLPEELQDLVGRTRTNDLDQKFTWTPKYAHVVASFMSLLLPPAERDHLIEHTGKEWGDEDALRHRGLDSKGRHGNERVYFEDTKGKIEPLWVAGIVEDIVWKEEMNTKKKRVQEMMARAERAEKLAMVRPA